MNSSAGSRNQLRPERIAKDELAGILQDFLRTAALSCGTRSMIGWTKRCADLDSRRCLAT